MQNIIINFIQGGDNGFIDIDTNENIKTKKGFLSILKTINNYLDEKDKSKKHSVSIISYFIFSKQK